MSQLTAILVDDEISNLKGLEKKLNTFFPEIEIAGMFQSPEDAINAINATQFDVLFLDIQMPRIDGFELLTRLKHINFQIIFVTAYSDYAIEAFKQSAVDYILKPIDNDDLKVAVQKALANISSEKEKQSSSKLLDLLSDTVKKNKVIVPTSKGISFIPEEEVMHLEGYEGYTKIHLTNKSMLTSSYNLGKFEKALGSKFFKCHKSHIINLEHVRHFENEGYIVLDNDYRVPISKTNKKAFLNLFK
ncbi:two-component system LytT family response regulator [Mesoflavibacter sabulilitoris]|uniref:DNA-binding response regulator n=1 Tax=Mesoflavibacter zeaxanthinifaciens subsp. sabulilitoris TaxID=1520893 RepID=A0A2T1NFH0_9FLAO|nr:LytTR family DNA-binding domain-containing protein [Mesoflavibacter zeaxanthinifaciens]MBB3124770.1 two-component system LytT family response regulator [Mesoflavibacter zeaxanthinifaciens subsp. sabulilitoris]PSG91136.1 DNA-binding response regulator [Mesoflavibacter zeaxanthinifaciens subsp. sabulilitoris]